MGANAQTTVPTYVASQVLTAQQLNDSARTGVPVFSTTTTRDAAFGGTGEKVLAEGQMCYIEAAPKRLQVYNGTAWIDFEAEWTAFTPTWTTGYTRGNGVTSSSYVRIGKTVIVAIQEALGSTSSVTGSLTVTMPVAGANVARVNAYGMILDSGTALYAIIPYAVTASSLEIYATNATTTYASSAGITATIPMTWAANDLIRVTAIYDT